MSEAPDELRGCKSSAPADPAVVASLGWVRGWDGLTEALAIALCNADDSMRHMEQTDDHPCSECRVRAERSTPAVRAHYAAALEGVEALVAEWESDRDVCLAWIADPEMHVDPDHPRRLSDKADVLNRHAEALRRAARLGVHDKETGLTDE